MRGVNASTGTSIDGIDHLAQSIGDILSTPIGSRVMRRDYGSLLPQLVDQPFNGATRVRLFGAIATALMRWEPRLRLTRVSIEIGSDPGAVTVTVDGVRTDTPTATSSRITVPLSLSAA